MIFGNPDTIAIEIGELVCYRVRNRKLLVFRADSADGRWFLDLEQSDCNQSVEDGDQERWEFCKPEQISKTIQVQFRFIFFGQYIGEWDDRFPLTQTFVRMKEFLDISAFRRDDSLRNVDSKTFFDKTFTAFYETDYTIRPWLEPDPNLRDRYHLSEVGGDSICDLYGIVVAGISAETSRIVVKDFRREEIWIDREFKTGEIEKMGRPFVEWTKMPRSLVLMAVLGGRPSKPAEWECQDSDRSWVPRRWFLVGVVGAFRSIQNWMALGKVGLKRWE